MHVIARRIAAATAAAAVLALIAPAGATVAEPTSTAPPSASTTADPGDGAIQQRYESMTDEEKAQVGEPVAEEVVVDEGLRYQDFTHARFYWTPDSGVTVVRGLIYQRFLELGGHDEVGVPITDELASSGGGRYSDFRTRDGAVHSAIYFSTETGAHLVTGPILEHFRELGEDAHFGSPATDTQLTPDAFGAYNHFVMPGSDREDASIYWTQPTGANAVQGAIRDAWAASGWEAGPLGYP